MTNAYIVLGAAALVAAIAVTARRRQAAIGSTQRVRLSDIANILQRVSAAGEDGTFAVFLFGEKGEAPAVEDTLNLQFSVERGHTGLDWVLLAPRNIAARERVTVFFAQRGSPLTQRSANGVDYLRTERGDLAALARELLTRVFGVTDQQSMDLVAEGFEWEGEADGPGGSST